MTYETRTALPPHAPPPQGDPTEASSPARPVLAAKAKDWALEAGRAWIGDRQERRSDAR